MKEGDKMSDSNLATYILISPNCNKPRNHKIDTITVHHMAGNLTVETCGEIFQNKKRQASSNYSIGTDGRIGLYVHEKDRAWTSGSPSNDHRAITIEVANDGGAETNWHVSDKALASLIDLLEDVCRRNDIKKLIWSDSKAERVGHKNGVNMTVHRDFQATLCPGPYLLSKLPWVANEVNKRLEEDEEMLTYEQWVEYYERYQKESQDKIHDQWEKDYELDKNETKMKIADNYAEPALKWAKETGIMIGDTTGNQMPQSYVKREDLACVLYSQAMKEEE